MDKILLVDDERPILEVLGLSLASEGYEVETAENGEEGLRIFENDGIKIVITDIKMPGIDGIELLKRIKALDDEAEVIVITGHGDMDSAIFALRHGASDFITKPIRDEALMLALERAQKKVTMAQLLKEYTHNLERKVEQYTEELRQAQEELIRRERLATIGETVTGLAHYIKNILNGLRGGTYKVNSALKKDDSTLLEEGWDMVQRNIEKISDLVFDLLNYSKERTPNRTLCRPNDIVMEVVNLLQARTDEQGIKLAVRTDPQLKDAYLDPKMIHDVLLNLLTNALDACGYDREHDKVPEHEVGIATRLEPPDTLLFEISDNGCGMDEETQRKLFTRFFSTKGGSGTGLGLLNAQKSVRELGGAITVQSEEGKGTIFAVRLPKDDPGKSAELSEKLASV
jgi:signal transduction histidine kinase